MKHGSTVLRVLAVASAAALTVAGLSSGAAAAPAVSTLVASPTSLTFNAGGLPQSVDVALDSECSNALNTGLSYSIGAVSDSATVTINPASAGPLSCATSGSNPPATFSVSVGAACGSALLTFTPVVANNHGSSPKGQQAKVAGTTVAVTVNQSDGTACGSGGGIITVGGDRPAPPAVANLYLNGSRAGNMTLWNSCAAAYPKAGKLWRGALIKDVTGWMQAFTLAGQPVPMSIKNDETLWPEASDWISYVTDQVDYFCGTSATASPDLDDLP